MTVAAVNDDLDNPNNQRTATITYTPTSGGYENVSVDDVAVTVRNDDGFGVTVPRRGCTFRTITE